MTFRRTFLSLMLAGACAPALAAEARIDLSSLDDATVSSRFIVKYRTGSAERTQAAARDRSLAAAAGRMQTQLRASGAAGAASAKSTLRVDTLRAIARSGMHVVKASRRLSRSEAETLMRSIAADPNVEYVAVDAMLKPAALPNDPLLATHQMWHYGAGAGGARVTGAWEQGARGDGVVVAVLDTGVTHHADLEANLLPGYDFISDHEVSGRATDERVPGGWDLGDWTTAGECGAGSGARSSSWHGTHVSGTIAEVTGNGIGGAGIAPNARIVPLRVLGHCGGYTSDIADAIVWAAGGHIDGVPENPHPAEVINMSLGGSQACPLVTQAAIDAAVSLGTTVVVAGGNENADASNHSPASCNNVVTVAATGYSGQRASYSNYGSRIDLSAPGGAGIEGSPNGYIWSTHNTGTTTPLADRYAGMGGTSMATPHVVGIVALMQSVAPKPLMPAQVEGLLKASARPFPTRPDRPIGVGIVDASAAVERARSFGQPLVSVPLTNGVGETLPPLGAGQSVLYGIDVPAGATKLEFLSFGGRGTLGVYGSYEADPTASMNLASSLRPGTNQVVTISAPAGGRYYFRVQATADSAGVTVRAKVY